jgi:hypothetical protein
MRIKFKKNKQRKFLDLVVMRLNCLSLRKILQFGFDVPYSSLKNYYTERRTIPIDFFNDLCYLSKINKKKLDIKYLDDNWGQTKSRKTGV